MSKIKLIITREYLNRVTKKSFLIMTLLTPFIIIALGAVPALLAQIKDTDTKTIAVIDRTGKYAELFESNETYKFAPVDAPNTSALEYFNTQDGATYGVLMITGDLLKTPGAMTFYSDKTANMGLKKAIITPLEEFLRNEKIDSYQIEGLRQIVQNLDIDLDLTTVKWNEDGNTEETSADLAMAMGFIFTFLIYIFIFTYGGMIIQSVVQEKTNRIVEVIISSVKPFDLMMGKIIGVSLVGFTQLIIWGIVLTVASMILGIGGTTELPMGASQEMMTAQSGLLSADMLQKINGMLAGVNFPLIIGCFLLYFMGGYLLYASLFAAIGSVVDQEEDTQQFMIPVTMVIIFAFYAALYSVENPDGPLAFWGSIIPITSPIVMMVRLPYDVQWWELALSLVLLYASAIGAIFVSSKIYRIGILMYGKKVGYKDIYKWLRY